MADDRETQYKSLLSMQTLYTELVELWIDRFDLEYEYVEANLSDHLTCDLEDSLLELRSRPIAQLFQETIERGRANTVTKELLLRAAIPVLLIINAEVNVLRELLEREGKLHAGSVTKH